MKPSHKRATLWYINPYYRSGFSANILNTALLNKISSSIENLNTSGEHDYHFK